LAFCDAYIENKEEFDYKQLNKQNVIENLNLAFETAEKRSGIPKLLDAQEVSDGNVDERSLVLYISLFFHAFVAKQQEKLQQARLQEQMRGLEGSLEERAKRAQDLLEENTKLKGELEQLQNELRVEQTARTELQENYTYLEEKVEVLNQLREQEKESLQSSKSALEKEMEKLKEELSVEKNKVTELSENKVILEGQVSSLDGKVLQLTSSFEAESGNRKKEAEVYSSRAKVEIKGLEILKKNLEEHVEDLHRWQKYLDIEGEVDFNGQLRPQILLDISKDTFDEQLEYLAHKLEKENEELSSYLKQKETEQKAKKSQEKKKKERQGSKKE